MQKKKQKKYRKNRQNSIWNTTAQNKHCRRQHKLQHINILKTKALTMSYWTQTEMTAMLTDKSERHLYM